MQDLCPNVSTEAACLSHLAAPAGARCVIQGWSQAMCVVSFITALTHQQCTIINLQPNRGWRVQCHKKVSWQSSAHSWCSNVCTEILKN